MESFFGRYKNALVLMLVLLAQVVLLAMQVRRPSPDLPDGHNVRLWRYVVAGVVTPPERLAHNLGARFRGVWSDYINLRGLRETNRKLEDENDRLRLEQASLAEDAREGQRLREMLDFRGRYIDKTVPAQVIGTAGTDQAHAIYIDKGFDDGIRAQMPVITPDGIIGKVKNVFPRTAQVLLISDQTSGAGVMLESTRIRGVMKGNASGQPQIINISPDERIKPGEAVLTSGGDQVYPRGLPVGTVESVTADPDTSYVNVLIKPNANLAKLEEVMVVTEFSGKMPFTQEKDMMQSEIDALALKQRAADVLSEKLPSLRELNSADPGDADTETAAAGDPARPMRPPQALHPDRYTPGAAPPAATLTPGAAPPVTRRAPAADSSASTTARASTPATGPNGAAGNPEVTIVNRFPAKVVPPPPAATAANTTAAASSSAARTTPSAATMTAGGASASSPRPARIPATGATGMSLPLQPADANAARRAAALNAVGATTPPASRPVTTAPPATASGTTPAAVPPRVPRVAAVAGTAATPGTQPSAPRQAQASPGASTSPANPGPGAASPGVSRRIAIPSDSNGGILTPAGMGLIGSAPRPRTTPPATTAAPAGQPNSGARPATTAPARPQATPPSTPVVRPQTQTSPPGAE